MCRNTILVVGQDYYAAFIFILTRRIAIMAIYPEVHRFLEAKCTVHLLRFGRSYHTRSISPCKEEPHGTDHYSSLLTDTHSIRLEICVEIHGFFSAVSHLLDDDDRA